MTDEVEILCRKACNGEHAAASDLVRMFYARIFAYLRRFCGNDDDAADLTQKTFGKAWSSLNLFQHRSSFSTWLHGIAHHVYVDWRRKPNRNEDRSEAWWEAREAESATPFEDTAQKDMAHQLYYWVDQLEEEQRQAVHLHYYQGLSLNETAEVLGIATSTLKYRLKGALEFLRSKTAEPIRH